MKILMKIVIAVSILVLVGCGGGASSVSSELPYIGKSGKAELNEENSQNFLEMIESSFANLSEDFDDEFVAFGRVEQMHSKVIAATKSKIVSKSNKVVKSETIQGAKSGTAKVTVEQISASTAVATYVFSNFDNNEDLYMDGTLVLKATEDSEGDIKEQTMTFKLLTIKSSTENAKIDGSIEWTLSDTGKRTVENYTIKDTESGRMYKYDNFVTMRDSYNHIIAYQGKIFDSKYGYVDVETSIELEYNQDDSRKPIGEVKITGETSQALIRYAYEGRVRVELDSDKDGEIDSVIVYKKDDSGEFVSVPNAAPVVKITFPQSIYTDTDMSTVSVHVYDPDLDEFTTSYEWEINDISADKNILALDHTLFKKHDILKLCVSANETRVGVSGEEIGHTTCKDQEVLNSRPIVNSAFTRLQLDIGDTQSLASYTVEDADNDPIEITWKHYLVNEFMGAQTIDEYYNPSSNDCNIAIEMYDTEHTILFEDLSDDQKEDFRKESCPGMGIPGTIVAYPFIHGNTFDAVASGLYFHEMVVSDGEYNRTRVFDSNISKIDIVDRIVNNSHRDSVYRAYNIFMKDFDGDGHKDLIYISYITKHDEGSSFTEPTGEVIEEEPFDYRVPVLIIEYRDGDTVLKKEQVDINNTDLDNFYVHDLNGDGKQDILLTHTDKNDAADNSRFGVMIQDKNGSLGLEEDVNLSYYRAMQVEDITGDGTEDLILSATDMWHDLGIRILSEENDITVPLTLPEDSFGRKILIADMDNNAKKDIIVINKNATDDTGHLVLECSILVQDSDGAFDEEKFAVTLEEDIADYDFVVDVVISDFGSNNNIFIVATTKQIYLLALRNNRLEVIKTLKYGGERKNKLSTRILPPVDINHDGKKDILVIDSALYSETFLGVFIQRESFDFFMEQDYSSGASGLDDSYYVLGDINDDGNYEIFFSTGDDALSEIYFK